ncbi:tetratricopeptide repeat protein, partial [Candidatus Bathyarchaeota archaeon]|nr:tetratricopeptide repeat protein [Candidatus Bathyarchaeota archaeon]
MASVKAQTKAIGDAVKRNQFDDAIDQIHTLFKKDPKNYLGYDYPSRYFHHPVSLTSPSHIFLGFSLEKKDQPDDAEQAFQSAAAIQPEGPQAWQGLIKLYEKLGSRKLAAHKSAVLSLGGVYASSDDHQKCRELTEKYLNFAKEHGDPRQYVDALSLMTPDSPLYEALEGLVPRPAVTYETMATILETDEKKRINTLIGERRTRIGARLSEVTASVKLEVLGQSQLAHIYRQLINWTSDDELRRVTEEKLLRHCYDRLIVTPAGPEKSEQRDIVTKLANDMVIIKHPFKFAWDIAIDWNDYKDIAEWDVNMLRDYCAFFPDSDVYKVITGFLTSAISPFPKQAKPPPAGDISEDDETDSSEEDSDGGAPTSIVPVTDEDRLLMMTDGIATTNSLLAYRLMGEYYQYLEEHESVVELMRKGIVHLKEERTKSGFAFENVGASFTLYLATSLVFYQSPRHHEEAMSLFNAVLAHDPVSTPAMIGVGLIYEEEEEYVKAADFLTRALERDSSNLRVRTEAAWVKALGGDHAVAKEELESCIPLLEKKKGSKSDKELLALAQYRLGRCIWDLDSSRAARKSRKGAYAHFLAALKSNLNLAPAYTSLGRFYGDYANDKKRARRCFQKAV